jgi:hypothetical protein
LSWRLVVREEAGALLEQVEVLLSGQVEVPTELQDAQDGC